MIVSGCLSWPNSWDFGHGSICAGCLISLKRAKILLAAEVIFDICKRIGNSLQFLSALFICAIYALVNRHSNRAFQKMLRFV